LNKSKHITLEDKKMGVVYLDLVLIMMKEWITNFVLEFASISQNHPQILRNINFVPEFVKCQSISSFQLIGVLTELVAV